MEKTLLELCKKALSEGRKTLLEPELYAVLRKGGISVPDFYLIDPSKDVASQARTLGSEKVVLKVVSPDITHKTEMGGVKVASNDKAAIASTAKEILSSIEKKGGKELLATVRGVMVTEFVRSAGGLGSEVFFGLRWSRDMGHVFAVGFGGLDAEEMAAKFAPGQATVIFSPALLTTDEAVKKLSTSFAFRRITGKTREAKPYADEKEIAKAIEFFARLSNDFSNKIETGIIIEDFEINPFFAGGGRLVAVDAFMRFSEGHTEERKANTDDIFKLLQPETAAVIGVSSKGMNPGRVILKNLLRENFLVENIRVIRPDSEEIDGVKCVKSVSDLPWAADLFVVAVAAAQVSDLLAECVASRKARTIVLIPGGMGETEAGKEIDRKVRDIVFGTREKGGWSPAIVGPNCLGIRSRPGRYDTLFIPATKFPLPEGNAANVALVCQSGAFMITRMTDLPFINAEYAISAGNQMDLSLADFVEGLLEEDAIKTIALYIEGFKPLDGLRLARFIKKGRSMGKDFLVYKAGRTPEGITATSSHTASISGDYASCVEMLRDAGALIVDNFTDYNGLLTIATLQRNKDFKGKNIGIISNAGFETVGTSDNILSSKKFKLAKLAPQTVSRIKSSLDAAGIGALINVHNPLDLTPMAGDAVLAECLKAYADDPGIDLIVMGFVPMTPTMKTLPAGSDRNGVDNVEDPTALPAILPPIVKATQKPVVTVVDAGKLYDPLVEMLLLKGVPCFRTCDNAVRLLELYADYKSR